MNVANDLALSAPIWLLMVGCLIVLLAETLLPGRTGRLAGFLSAATIALALARLLAGSPGGEPFGLLVNDSLARALSGLLLVIGFAVVVMAEPLLESLALGRGEFHALLLASLSGMLLLVSARDLLVLFLAIELLSIPLYVLASYRRLTPASLESGFKYFLLGAFASGFLVYGIALLYGAAGDTRYGALARFAAASADTAGSAAAHSILWSAGLALLLVGLGFKAAVAPFHAWVPDVYQGAPTPVTAFMAAGVKAAAFGALLRLALEVLPDTPAMRTGLAIVACVSMVVGNLGALLQTNLKRLLAWSSIAHAGYLLVGVLTVVASRSNEATRAVVVYLAAYALTTIAAFGWLLRLGRESTALQEIRTLRGLARERPWMAAALALCFLSFAGVPLTAGFIGKLDVLKAAWSAGTTLLVPLLVLVATSVIGLGYYLRVVAALYMERPADEEAPAAALFSPTGLALVTVVTSAAVLLLGIWPTPLLRWLES